MAPGGPSMAPPPKRPKTRPPTDEPESQREYLPLQASAPGQVRAGKQKAVQHLSEEDIARSPESSPAPVTEEDDMPEGSRARASRAPRTSIDADMLRTYYEYLAQASDDSESSQLPRVNQQDPMIEIDAENLGMDLEDIGALSGENVERYAIYSSLLDAVDEDGFDPLIDAAFEAEVNSGSQFGEELKQFKAFWRDKCALTLFSMPQKAIPQIIKGNLRKAELSDPELKSTLDAYREQAKDHPCIYVRVLADSQGNSMLLKHAKMLLRCLKAYGDTRAISPLWMKNIHAFDYQFDPAWDQSFTAEGRRKRLEVTAGVRSEKRTKCLVIFVKAFDEQIQAAEAAGKERINALQYVGYAIRADEPEKEHVACSSSSNWLATLVQSICNLLKTDDKYTMYFYPVCLLQEEEQGFIAEAFLMRIARAYYHTGHGFCIDIAGKSMTSLRMAKLTREKKADRWNEHQAWVRDNTEMGKVYDAQYELRVRARAKWHEEQARKKKEAIARIDAEKKKELERLELVYSVLDDELDEETRAILDSEMPNIAADIEELREVHGE